jgi:hypothetical protein
MKFLQISCITASLIAIISAAQIAAPATVSVVPGGDVAAAQTAQPAAGAAAMPAMASPASATPNAVATANQARNPTTVAQAIQSAAGTQKQDEKTPSVIDDTKQLLDQAAAFYARNVAPDGSCSNPQMTIPNQILTTRKLIAKLKGLLIELRLQKLEAEVFKKDQAAVAALDKKITEVQTFWAAHTILLSRLLNGEKVGPITAADFKNAVAALEKNGLGVPLTDLATKPTAQATSAAAPDAKKPVAAEAVMVAAKALLTQANQKLADQKHIKPAGCSQKASRRQRRRERCQQGQQLQAVARGGCHQQGHGQTQPQDINTLAAKKVDC